MPPIKTKRFFGYTSKPDKVTNNPGLLTKALNCIINKGDICNFPYAIKSFNSFPFEDGFENLIFIHYFEKSSQVPGESSAVPIMVLFSRTGKLYASAYGIFGEDINGNPLGGAITNFVEVTLDSVMALPEVMYPQWPLINFDPNAESNEINILTANVIQVGDWTVLLTPFNFISGNSTPLPYTPQMIRLRGFEYVSSPNILYSLEPQLLGIRQPSRISYDSALVGYITGRYDFGFSFVTLYDGTKTDNSVSPPAHIHSLHDIESNVTILNNEQSYNNNSIIFKIYLPVNWISVGGTGTRALQLGIYVRSSTQSVYYFIGYSGSLESYQISSDVNGQYIRFQYSGISGFSDLTILQDPTRNAPLTGLGPILGAHDVPKPSRHAAFYKQRMYYFPVGYPHNFMQVSSITPDIHGEVETGKFINYIERLEQVGKPSEDTTGVIEYLGQLVIFKETETYILTDDVTVGEIRILFKDLGCVNIHGGQAYVVIDDKLYFGSKKGIFVYNGGEPVKISDTIHEALEEISSLRYSFMRLRHLPRENLLLVCFPLGLNCDIINEFPYSFAYNYLENVWTAIDQRHSDIIDDKTVTQNRIHSINTLLNKQGRLELLGLLTNDNNFTPADPGRQPEIETEFFDLEEPQRVKHWKFLKIYMVTPQTTQGFAQLAVDFINEVGLGIGESDTLTQPVYHNENKELKRIGGFSKKMYLRILGLDGFQDSTFRINGFEIEAHVKGRR